MPGAIREARVRGCRQRCSAKVSSMKSARQKMFVKTYFVSMKIRLMDCSRLRGPSLIFATEFRIVSIRIFSTKSVMKSIRICSLRHALRSSRKCRSNVTRGFVNCPGQAYCDRMVLPSRRCFRGKSSIATCTLAGHCRGRFIGWQQWLDMQDSTARQIGARLIPNDGPRLSRWQPENGTNCIIGCAGTNDCPQMHPFLSFLQQRGHAGTTNLFAIISSDG